MAIALVQSTHNQEVFSTSQGMTLAFPAAVGAGHTLVTVVIGKKSPNPYPAGNSNSAAGAMDVNSPAPVVSDGTTAQSFALTAAAAPAAALTLSAVAASSGGVAVYTGTITGGGSNAFVGYSFTIAGFVGANNNGTFVCTASTTTTLTLNNAAATAETHAGTATFLDSVYTGTITGGAANAFAGRAFAVAGFVTGANNGTFNCVQSTATTLTLANASAVNETHAATATTGGSVSWVSAVAFKSIDAQTAAVSYSGGANFTVESLPDMQMDYPAIYLYHKSVGVQASEKINVKSAYLGPQSGTTQDANGAAGVSLFQGGVNAVAMEFSGTASPTAATEHHQLTAANPALSGATAGAAGNVQIAVGYMKNANAFAAANGFTVVYMDKCASTQDHFVVAYKIITGADQANFANPLGYKMGVVTLNLT